MKKLIPLLFVCAVLGMLLCSCKLGGDDSVDFDDDGGDLLDLEEDLLGRSGADDEINNLIAQLGSLTLQFDLVNSVGIKPEIRLVDGAAFSKQIDFTTGTVLLVIDGDDIPHVINTYPFTPEAFLWLKEGDHWIYHEGKLEINDVRVLIGMDIDYSIPLFEK